MKTPVYTNRFKRDYRLMLKRGKAEARFASVAERLLAGLPLDHRHQDHPLKGEFTGWRDCHLEANWILIYRPTETSVIFGRTGTHSDIFG